MVDDVLVAFDQPSRQFFNPARQQRSLARIPEVLGARLKALENFIVTRDFGEYRVSQGVGDLLLVDRMMRLVAVKDKSRLDAAETQTAEQVQEPPGTACGCDRNWCV